MTEIEVAVVGGSGLYDVGGLEDVEEHRVKTPFGDPSDLITVGSLNGIKIAFLPRHGRGHTLSPSEVPYKANIYALKVLGVRYIIGVSACGSLREDYEPGHIVIPNQLVDFTKGKRESTFFGGGLVAHVAVAHPFSTRFNQALYGAVRQTGAVVHNGGVFVTIEGPRFSTRGEANLFRQWGMSIVGMTTSPEAFLAAEAEIAYSVMAHVTDYDVWHETTASVSVEMVVKTLSANTHLAQEAIVKLLENYDEWAGNFPEHHNLADALSLVNDWGEIPDNLKSDLAPIIGKYIID
ncbi:MAG: S-methyl-5'-thioadenosine phosphorylase [Anaerolineae bacterium]|nr:MAG: S-methyl-5'-thioadenosine phosphorylase [Anaerolineae bacterium]